MIAVLLVTLVVFVFLRSAPATIIPGVAVPVSLIGTFGVMYLLGYSLDNLSLMALTIATGFVVDDAIVVLENISRHRDQGLTALEAALLGALPLALGRGVGSELRQPLGIAIVGGLIVSQMLTLFTTPVVYLYLDHVRLRFARIRVGHRRPMPPDPELRPTAR